MYPVLRPASDDYPAGRFDTKLKVSEGLTQNLYIRLRYNLEEPLLKEFIQQGTASCACLVECRPALFRHVELATNEEPYEIKLEIELESLVNQVEIHPFIIATKNLEINEKQVHEEYKGEVFKIQPWQPLAFDQIWKFEIDPQAAPLRSIFSFEPVDDGQMEYGQFEVSTDPSKDTIGIRLTQETFNDFRSVREKHDWRQSVFLSALIQVMVDMSSIDEEILAACHWARRVRETLNQLGINQTNSLWLISQMLLDNPYQSMLSEQYADENEEEYD